MELFVNRKEIRRRIQARMGHVTDDSAAPQTLQQYNEFIRAAATEVYRRCQWAQTSTESTAEIGIDQRFVNYPSQAGPGEIISIGLWDANANRYITLRRGRIPVALDDDPLVVEGEPASVSGRAKPERYELKRQIELWPRPDQAYQLKIDHTISPNMDTDDDISVVDAEAIILWAMADAYDFQGDDRLASIAREKFELRIKSMINEQHPLTMIRRGKNDRLAVGNRPVDNYIPDSGTWPSVKEGA